MNPFPHRFSTALATADLPNPVGPSSTKTFFPSSKAFWMLSKACNCPRRGCIAGGKNLCIPLKPPPLKGGIANFQTHVTCFDGTGAHTAKLGWGTGGLPSFCRTTVRLYFREVDLIRLAA